MECIDRLIEGPCRVTECLPKPKQSLLTPKKGQASKGPCRDITGPNLPLQFTQVCKGNSSDQSRACSGRQEALRAARSLPIPTKCHFGLKEALLDQKRPSQNSKGPFKTTLEHLRWKKGPVRSKEGLQERSDQKKVFRPTKSLPSQHKALSGQQSAFVGLKGP